MSSPSPSEPVGTALTSGDEGEEVVMLLSNPRPTIEFQIDALHPDFLAFMCCDVPHACDGNTCIPFWIERGTE